MDFVLNNVMACAYHFLRHKSESRHNDGFAPNDNAAARGAAAVWKFAAGVVSHHRHVFSTGESSTLFSLF